MKKVFLFAALVISMTACTDNNTMFEEPEVLLETRAYTSEQLQCITEVYDFCLTFFEIPAYLLTEQPTTEQMIDVIRYCDLQDRGGDIFCGWDSYDTIKDIIWPNGYANN